MVNAKEELLNEVGDKQVELVRILYNPDYRTAGKRIEGTLATVLPELDFTYDGGYGTQELFGFIWYTDGTWSERGEYDGSEWWSHKTAPPININIEVDD